MTSKFNETELPCVADIRIAVPGDAEALAQLAERTFREAFAAENEPADMDAHCKEKFSADVQRREILDSNCTTIVADVDGDLVAFAQVRLHSLNTHLLAEHPAELYRIYVSSEWHGRGLAQDVMEEVLATAAKASADTVWLGVWEHNPKAIAFYNKYGFEVVGDQVYQLGDDRQRDLVMAIEIER